MNVVLMGYMASGKSIFGYNLAQLIGYDFVDLDDYIEEYEGITISEIFREKGEIYFRKLEHKLLLELLTIKQNCVLSLGGGTPCYAKNMEMILTNQSTVSFYLKVSVNELANRLENEKIKRPLIANIKSKEKLVEYIGKHLFERSAFYNQANHTVETDNKSIRDILEQIIFILFQNS